MRCTYDPATRGGDAPDGRKVKGTIHWVSAAARRRRRGAPVRHLFTVPKPDDAEDYASVLNPNSLEVLTDAQGRAGAGRRCRRRRTSVRAHRLLRVRLARLRAGAPVFNRTVGLRDTWAKIESKG